MLQFNESTTDQVFATNMAQMIIPAVSQIIIFFFFLRSLHLIRFPYGS